MKIEYKGLGARHDPEIIEDLLIGTLYVDDEGEVMGSFPSLENNKLKKMNSYTWENWDIPLSGRSLKHSYDIVKQLFAGY